MVLCLCGSVNGMTNLVNKTFAEAAERTHGEAREHLVTVFMPLFKDRARAAAVVEEVTEHMGRYVAPVDEAARGEPPHE